MHCNLSELPVGSGDPLWPLRFLDPRFEPRDPIFDPEEVEAEPRHWRRKKRLSSALLAAAIVGCGGSAAPAIHASDAVLVQLEEGASPPAGRAGPDSGPPIVALESVAPDAEPAVLRVPVEPGTDPIAAAEQLARQPGVQSAEPIYMYYPSRAPNDPRYKDLWGLAKIDARDAWARTVGDRKITVAVVDDGVALDHPDLKPNLWVNPQEIAGNGEDDDGDGLVDDVNGADMVDHDGDPSPAPAGDVRWHGSHVSGTIGAAGDNHLGVVGVNWKVSIMAVRGLGPNGGRSDDLARSIDYAVDHGARVINASWGGGGQSQVLAKSIDRAAKHGVLFVAAAGNSAGPKPEYPASLAGVLSVAATTPDDVLAPFSNRGARIAAPGVGILSTTAPGQYERYDGTSMAAPHVSGAAALLWSAHPDASLAQVTKALLAGADHGRLDVALALGALERETGALGPLRISRDSLTFTAKSGRKPRAQTISIRTEGGGTRKWKAAADRAWISLRQKEGETPARVSIAVDPSRLGTGKHLGTVQFTDDSGAGPVLEVALQIGNSPAIAVAGQGCEMRGDTLHASAGAGCTLQAAEGEASSVRWVLPGGRQTSGARFYGQFLRAGRFEIRVGGDEGETDSVPVVIE